MAQAPEAFTLPFERLTGPNWEEWAIRMKYWLLGEQLWNCMQTPPPQASETVSEAEVAAALERDQSVPSMLRASVDAWLLPNLEEIKEARVTWQALQKACVATVGAKDQEGAVSPVGAESHVSGSCFYASTHLCDGQEQR